MGLSPAASSRASAGIRGTKTSFGGMLAYCPSSRGVADGSPLSCIFVVLSGPVGRRVFVRLPDALDPVNLFDVLGDDGRDEGFPILPFQHPMTDGGARKSLAVQERRREHLQAVFPKEADDQVRVRIHDVETWNQRGHMAHPNTVHVGVRDRDDVVIVDAFGIEGPPDHLIPFARGERVLSRVTVLGRANPDDDLAVRLQDSLHHREVAAVERLEPTDEKCATGHSSYSPRKWPM